MLDDTNGRIDTFGNGGSVYSFLFEFEGNLYVLVILFECGEHQFTKIVEFCVYAMNNLYYKNAIKGAYRSWIYLRRIGLVKVCFISY